MILAGDHIYKQDYSVMLMDHVNSGAKCTIGCIEVPRSEAHEFGVMAVNENLKVKAFVENQKIRQQWWVNLMFRLLQWGFMCLMRIIFTKC